MQCNAKTSNVVCERSLMQALGATLDQHFAHGLAIENLIVAKECNTMAALVLTRAVDS